MVTGTVAMLRRITNEPSTSGTYSDSDMTNYLAIAGSDLYGAGYLIWAEKVAGLQGAADDYSHFMLNYCASHRGAKVNLLVKDPTETTLGYPTPLDNQPYYNPFDPYSFQSEG